MLVRSGVLAVAAAAVLLLAGCAQSGTNEAAAPSQAAGSESGDPGGELTIFAAASLTESFTDLVAGFEAEYPGVTVRPLSFDGSSTLATQIGEGAPVDVFASADEVNMDRIESLLLGSAESFATNTLQIAVAPGNPLGIGSLADLDAGDVQLVLCAAEVPCGRASNELLERAGVTPIPVSEEQNVKAVLTKVAGGEADAGLVYVTDVLAAASVIDGVPVAGAELAANVYTIATIAESQNPVAAAAFIEYVLSPQGQGILAGYGFSAP